MSHPSRRNVCRLLLPVLPPVQFSPQQQHHHHHHPHSDLRSKENSLLQLQSSQGRARDVDEGKIKCKDEEVSRYTLFRLSPSFVSIIRWLAAVYGVFVCLVRYLRPFPSCSSPLHSHQRAFSTASVFVECLLRSRGLSCFSYSLSTASDVSTFSDSVFSLPASSSSSMLHFDQFLARIRLAEEVDADVDSWFE